MSVASLPLHAFDVVLSGNTFTRVRPVGAWGYIEETAVAYPANIGVQFLDNTNTEGNHAVYYNPAAYSRIFTVDGAESYLFATRTGHNDAPCPIALNRFVVFRGSTLLSNGGVMIAGATRNVLVERTTIQDSDVGIFVNVSATADVGPDGVVILD